MSNETDIKTSYNEIRLDLPKKSFSLFLGCVIPNRYPMIEKATRTVCNAINIELQDMNGASCCPAPGVFRSVDTATWLSLSARNITIAQENKSDIINLCNGCYGTLIETAHKLDHDDKLKADVNKILSSTGREYTGKQKVRHIMDILYFDYGIEKIKQLVKRKLNLNVAVHYGCHILKPSAIKPFGQDPDHPTFFDEIVEALGCTSLEYRKKMMCCGAGGAVRTANKVTASQLTLDKMREIRKVKADCIVVCCPFCQLQYDLGQLEIQKIMPEGEEPYRVPVIYITQLMGLAMGMDPKELGLIKPKNLKKIPPYVSVEPVLEKLGLLDHTEDN